MEIDLTTSIGWWQVAAIMIPLAGLSGFRLWVIDQRERKQRLRLEVFRGPIKADQPAAKPTWYDQLGSRLGPIVGVVEQQRLLKLMAAAGLKGETSLARFISMKLTSAVLFGVITWLLLEWQNFALFTKAAAQIAPLGIGLIIGWRLPDIILNHLVRRRRSRLEHSMPDALDLLVICAESGLSLNQAIDEVSQQLHLSSKDIADEFAMTSAEMRIMPDFGKALDNFIERTGLDQLNGFVAALKQSIKFGTPLAESLRTIAGEMRAEHQARMEERAARLPVLLAIPMMTFILPCLLMIVGTPVVLRLIDTFKNLTIGGVGVLR
jgi:tight adherence protein C